MFCNLIENHWEITTMIGITISADIGDMNWVIHKKMTKSVNIVHLAKYALAQNWIPMCHTSGKLPNPPQIKQGIEQNSLYLQKWYWDFAVFFIISLTGNSTFLPVMVILHNNFLRCANNKSQCISSYYKIAHRQTLACMSQANES